MTVQSLVVIILEPSITAGLRSLYGDALVSNLYIASTRPGEGKTAVTVGLLAALQKRMPNIGFIKPVGYVDIVRSDLQIDEDTLLVAKACNLHSSLQDASPITLDRGFPDRFLTEDERQRAIGEIIGSFSRVAQDRSMVVIEGSGHAAVGHNLGLSNGFLASLMNARMLLVTSGALAHPVDELALNKTFLEQWGVPLVGVIINRVRESDRDLIEQYTRPVLNDLGIELLGAIPDAPELRRPTMLEVREDLDADVFSGRANLSNRCRRVVVGAMTAAEAIGRLAAMKPGVLLVTPGDRSDIVIAALASNQRRLASGQQGSQRGIISGIILTGGLKPHPNTHTLLEESEIPTLLAKDDSFKVARRASEIVSRINPADKAKVNRIIELVGSSVDVPRLLEQLAD